MKPKRPETIEHGGRDWVEIKIAAKFARLQAMALGEAERSGTTCFTLPLRTLVGPADPGASRASR